MATRADILWVPVALMFLSACEGTPTAHDHDVAAAYDEAVAKAHENESTETCSDSSVPAASCPEPGLPNHAASAAAHRAAAKHHRERARVLREAAASACGDVDEVDATVGPFFDRRDITRVSVVASPFAEEVPLGATAFLRPSKTVTRGDLERLVACHLARNVAEGYDAAQMESCPLVLPGVHAEVGSGPRGLSVTVTSEDPAIAREIVARMMTLRDARGS